MNELISVVLVSAVKDVSLAFFAGEFFAIMGTSRSGKPTLLALRVG